MHSSVALWQTTQRDRPHMIHFPSLFLPHKMMVHLMKWSIDLLQFYANRSNLIGHIQIFNSFLFRFREMDKLNGFHKYMRSILQPLYDFNRNMWLRRHHLNAPSFDQMWWWFTSFHLPDSFDFIPISYEFAKAMKLTTIWNK